VLRGILAELLSGASGALTPVDAANNAEGYSTNGTVVTTGNSGGGSGTALAAINGTVTAINTDSAEGSWSYALAAVTATSANLRLNLPQTSRYVVAEAWFKLTGYPSTTIEWFRFQSVGGGGFTLNMTSTGFLQIGVTPFSSTGSAVPLNQWVKVYVTMDQGGSAGAGSMSVIVSDLSGTVLTQITPKYGLNFGALDFTQIGFGKTSNAGNLAAYGIDGMKVGANRTTPFAVAFSSSPALSGSGDLTTAGVPAVPVSVPLSGSGSLSAAVVPAPVAAVGLSGSGALSASVKPGPAIAAALSGSGALSAVRTPAIPSTVALSGSGVLSAHPLPTTVLNIGSGAGRNNFDLQMARSGDASWTLITQAQIEAGYEEAPYFATVGTGGKVQLSVPLDAPIISGSSGPRAELREVDSAGVNAAFDANVGTHELHGRTSILTGTPDVVVAQLHNGAADRISIRTQLVSGSLRLRVRVNGSSVTLSNGTLDYANPYVPGTEFEWKISVNGGAIAVYLDDMVTPVYTAPAGTLAATGGVTTWYFKAGVYAQATGSAGSSATVELRDLTVAHASGPAYSVTPALSGSGSLGVVGVPAIASTVGLSGSGSLSVARIPAIAAAAALSGSGVLSVAVSPAVPVSPALSGSGSLSVGVLPAVAVSAALSGSGTLTASATAPGSATPALSGAGSLTVTRIPAVAISAALSGSGVLTVAAAASVPALLALSGSGVLTTAVVGAIAVQAALSGSGALLVASVPAISRAVAFSGSGSLAVLVLPAVPRAAVLSGSGVLATSAGVPAVAGVVLLSGSGVLAAAASAVTAIGSAVLSGSGVLTVITDVSGGLIVHVPAVRTLVGAGSRTLDGFGDRTLHEVDGRSLVAAGGRTLNSGGRRTLGEVR
jgi:hypothetical protein